MIKLLSFIYQFIKLILKSLSKKFKVFLKFGIFINSSIIISDINKIFIGKNFIISANCSLYAEGNNSEKIIIKDNVALNNNVMINANNKGSISIGNNVIIGPNVVIRASNHIYQDRSKAIRYQSHSGGKIYIEEDVWIGSNSTILADVKISKGSIIGAGSVVTKNIPEYSIAVGVPAKVIKKR